MKDKILKILKESDGYCSGEKMSEALNISRAAVWKYIKKFRDEGYEIESVTNKGYRLVSSPDILSEAEIKAYSKEISGAIKCMYKTDSTNEEAKRNSSMPDGSVFIAEIQSSGKGRRGRRWVSEAGDGIWMSILSKPDIALADVSKITLAAGLAVCDAAKRLGIDAEIKWPNDIVVNKKKICGILTELSAEADGINYVVTGIGINVNTKAFAPELADKATSVYLEYQRNIPRAQIAAYVIGSFEKRYRELLSGGIDSLISDYKSVCLTLGKQVHIIRPTEEFDAYATDITPGGELEVDRNGEKIVLNSGEVSVRGIYGYI